MFKKILVLFLLSGLFSSSIIFGAQGKGKSRIRITTTVPAIASIFADIGGNKVQISSMSNVGECAHNYSLKPSQLANLRHSDLFIYISDDFENYAKKSSNGIDGKVIEIANFKGINLINEQNGNVNWHLWLDLNNAQEIGTIAFHTLSEMMPNEVEYFSNQYTKFIDALNNMKKKIQNTNVSNVIYISNEMDYFLANNPKINAHFVDMKNPSMENKQKLDELIKQYSPRCIFASDHIDINRMQAVLGKDIKVVPIITEAWSYVSGYEELFDYHFNRMVHSLEHCK